jgi:hypothetical protein
MENRKVINVLGYAGLIPFIAAAGLVLADVSLPGLDPLLVFSAYSALILSFLGGVLWGRALGDASQQGYTAALLCSNGIVLLGFAALLFLPIAPLPSLLLLALGFLLLIIVERTVFAPLFRDADAFYKSFRLSLTAVVVLIHGLVIFNQ